MKLGEIIKLRRKELGLTQQELAKDICAQALISRVEKGDIVPKKAILDKLEVRLELEKNELIKADQDNTKKNEINEVKQTIRQYLTARDYKTIELLLDHHKSLINSARELNDKVFFAWIDASLQHHLYDKREKTLEILNNIYLDDVEKDLAVEILNARGIIHYKNGDFDKALESYKKGIDMLDDSVSFEIRAKIILNYALTLEQKNFNKEALSYISEGIDLLVKNNSLYSLGDFHHTKGHIFYKLGNFVEAKECFELSASIFKLQNNQKLLSFSQLALTEINNKLSANSKEETQ
ncbi:helix-turn-helix domain-containing protein [Alkalibacterium olivapovliticus]|uniref:Tetratricopeptide repeat protein n=1 Tax=Alkalibacterium olivapovliticus TaxID=99907 RepID=A0A2T0W8F5_9LACT|nr:tetratricopeptide repeat protein [Alkalibacterium olivapovliticus]PRY82980.1 tetratricopeptide repeat protein [Alkalibacterium olivapovliticus]